MAETTDKYCPIDHGNCCKEQCALWFADYSNDDYCCSILSLAMRLADLKRIKREG